MLKVLAIKLLKSLLAVAFLTIVLSSASFSEENMCMDKEGFIYPLISETKCENKEDEEISLNEYRYIRDFDNKDRYQKLLAYREDLLKKKQEVNTEQKEVAEKPKISQEEKINIKKEAVKRYGAEKNKKSKQLVKKRKKELAAQRAKQKELSEQRKKEREILKAEKKRIVQERKKKLLAEKAEKRRLAEEKRKELLARKAERKRIVEEKRKELLARKAEKKRIAEEKRKQLLAEETEEKRISEEKRLAELELEKQLQESTENKNNELKIVSFQKKIVKKELLPQIINENQSIDFERIDELNDSNLKLLLAANTNLILIIPKDYESYSNTVSENEATSKIVAGTRSNPNPEFNRLQMEMRKTERELGRAQAEAERGFQLSQCYSCGFITQWGGVALQNKWQKIGAQLQSNLSRLTNSYSTVPEYIEKEVLRNYNYIVQDIKAEKKAIYQIIQLKDNKFFEKELSLIEEKQFKVASDISAEDKNYESLINQYDSINDVSRWENKRFASLSVENLNKKITEIEVKKEINKRELFASLNLKAEKKAEKKGSSWKRLFSKKSKPKKSSKNNLDPRFDSVVIVKTEDGMGAGFYVSEDEIITNYHVVEKSKSIMVIDKNRNRSSSIIIKKDLKRDLALLKTNAIGKPVIFFTGELKQGDPVEALGHPRRLKFSLTKGWVSSVRKSSSVYSATDSENVLFVQTDAAINPGNSGGPLFFKDKVVGVNTQGLRKAEGLNFAVHYSEVIDFINR